MLTCRSNLLKAAMKSILSIRVSKWMGKLSWQSSCPKWMGKLLWQSSCQEASARHIPYIPAFPGWGFVFQQDGALAHWARDTVAFIERKVPHVIPPTLRPPNPRDLNPVNYSIWSVPEEKVCRSRIANVNELATCVFDEWASFDQSIVYAAIG